jgi:hypothetical protein
MITTDAMNGFLRDATGSGVSLAEFIATVYKNKLVEIYMGDSYEDIQLEQISQSYPAVFCGKVVGAYKECLVLNTIFIHKKTHKIHTGKMLFINERGIRSLSEIDGNGTLADCFLRSRETVTLLDVFPHE